MNEFIKITNIQRFCSDDGPGIRTTVFLTGCNMHCAWCHNPENLKEGLIAFDAAKCEKCGQCVKVCKMSAHSIKNGHHMFDRTKCVQCFACVENCPSKSLYSGSYNILIDDLVDILSQDYDFYELSRGGITLSGGEPIIQRQRVETLIGKLKKKKINIAVETALNYKFDNLSSLLEAVDLFIVDLKAVSKNLHQKYTGVGNELILDNIIRLSDIKKIWVRIPVIPEINVSLSEIRKMGDFLKNIKAEKVELIPYHKMGISKYNIYGMEYKLKEVKTPTKDYIKAMIEILSKYGLPVEDMLNEYA